MPKSVEIPEFCEKLGVAMKRLHWSRAQLAQQVGIDKSLAGRWIRGDSRPTPQSLQRLLSAVSKHIPGLTAADFHLPFDRFAARIGIKPGTHNSVPNAKRLTLGGLKFAPPPQWGEPYLGLWAGFYQGLTMRSQIRIFAAHFYVDELGLRCHATEGNFIGEGPALATPSHLQCLFDVGPLHDRLGFCMLNGVHGPRAAAIDGIVSIIAGDAGGTPTASPILLFRIDDGLRDVEINISELAASIRQFHDRAACASDALALVRELAPPEVLGAVAPIAGAGGDHVLRMPVGRSLASFTTNQTWRQVASNLRRALGLERSRPQLRVLGLANE